MADNKKKTAYQNLNTFLNLDGAGLAPEDLSRNPEEKILLKAETPEDLKVKALEIQQKEVIFDKFFKIQQSGFQKAMQYEAARLPAYIDYEGMEFYPIIASALDLLMEESTTVGDDGKMLRIYSKKERIKEILEEFFYGTLNINVNLPFWTRNLAKYGDNFVYLLGEKGKGIRYARQLVNYDIERKDEFKDKKMRTIFKNRITGDEFNLFEVAHFRLLGDDKFLPYGSSVLNKVRRVFRQLIMAEDAMLTYRILRAGEKRVYKIEVGNMDDKDIEAYVYKVANKFKKQPQVYKNNGQIDYRFNILGNDEDIFMPVRDGKSTVIETLPGATNLDAIGDITYLRDNLFTGLGIPKPFLGFQGSAGEGKNLAQMDVRFSKKINRIQQALIQELNKMAIIHLYLKGFEDDLHEFTLSLTNPSTQADKLKIETLQAKVQLYNDMTRTESSGIAATSHTWAKRNIFNWSDKEIMEDLKNQRMERAISQELQDTGTIIPKTGIFAGIDKKYGTLNPLPAQVGGPPEAGEGDMSGGNPPPEAGATNAPQTPNELPPPEGAPAPQGQAEGVQKTKKQLNEDTFDEMVNQLVGTKNYKDNKSEDSSDDDDSLYSRAKSLNSGAKKMITEIDKLIHTSGNFNNEASDKNFTYKENRKEDKKKKSE
jgi:Bacteriophage T4-like portal protein (Gp20)